MMSVSGRTMRRCGRWSRRPVRGVSTALGIGEAWRPAVHRLRSGPDGWGGWAVGLLVMVIQFLITTTVGVEFEATHI